MIATASLVTVLIALPGGSPVSSDPGAPAIAWWVTLLPAVVGIGLTLALPRPRTPLPARVADRRRLRGSTATLITAALTFPVLIRIFGWAGSEWYVLAKLVLLILIPGIVVAILRGVRLDREPAAWRWWAPAIVLVVWVLLSQVAPWNPRHDFAGVDPAALLVGALATAITASLGEELFYRRWLQTRLEAGLGTASGIALTALLFALMHLGSHGTGEPLLDVARVIVAQGSFGLFAGVLWWRYRNLAAIVAAHLISNGWAVAVFLLS